LTDTPPPQLLAKDITPADADAVQAFLSPRLHEEMITNYGAPGYRMAFALDGIVRGAVVRVRSHHQSLEADNFPDRLARLICLQEIQSNWNTLWEAVFPWRTEDGYDHDRWVHVKYTDERSETFGEGLEASVKAELAAGTKGADA
jgi:hypothetical protein